MPLSLCVADKVTQLILTLHWECSKPSVFITFPIFRGLKLWCAGICFLSLAGKAIFKVRDKRRHDEKIKLPLSDLWFKAEVSQLCHTGPTQPTSRRGRWCYWVTAMLHGSPRQCWTEGMSSCDIPDRSLKQHRLLIYRSRSMKQHPAFVPVLTDCLFNKSPQKGDSCVPHPEVQAWFCYWLWPIVISHLQLNLTKSRCSAK